MQICVLQLTVLAIHIFLKESVILFIYLVLLILTAGKLKCNLKMHYLNRKKVEPGVPQSSVLGPL